MKNNNNNNKEAWVSYQKWHELLDAVCLNQGHSDNMDLASEMTAASGKHNSDAFEAAVKSLRNWRDGSHLPQRRNFALLTKVLNIDASEDLKKHWARLYTEARKGTGHEARDQSAMKPSKKGTLFAVVLTAVTAVAIGAGYISKTGLEGFAEEEQSADVEYRKAVSLNVGESIVVHGARGTCGENPPKWDRISAKLPKTEIGSWSAGGIGSRYSRKCGGPTPARGIVFTAVKSGSVEISLFKDPIKIHVK